MKEIKKERTVYDIHYEAIDGTVFTDKEECKKYEISALGVLRGKVMEYKVSEPSNAWDLMGGIDDHTITGFKLPTEEAVLNFLHWLYLECPWYMTDCHAERKAEIEKVINKAQAEGDIIIMGQNCDGNYYYINTRQNIINNLMNLDKK